MNIFQAADLLDTLYTVGTVALCVGCPTAVVGGLAVKFIVKAAVKKAVASGAAVGITATIAALAMMDGGGAGGPEAGQNQSPPLEDLETISMVIELVGEVPTIFLENKEIPKDEVEGKIRELLSNGKLERINCQNKLSPEDFSNWEIYIDGLNRRLTRNSEFKFIIE